MNSNYQFTHFITAEYLKQYNTQLRTYVRTVCYPLNTLTFSLQDLIMINQVTYNSVSSICITAYQSGDSSNYLTELHMIEELSNYITYHLTNIYETRAAHMHQDVDQLRLSLNEIILQEDSNLDRGDPDGDPKEGGIENNYTSHQDAPHMSFFTPSKEENEEAFVGIKELNISNALRARPMFSWYSE